MRDDHPRTYNVATTFVTSPRNVLHKRRTKVLPNSGVATVSGNNIWSRFESRCGIRRSGRDELPLIRWFRDEERVWMARNALSLGSSSLPISKSFPAKLEKGETLGCKASELVRELRRT